MSGTADEQRSDGAADPDPHIGAAASAESTLALLIEAYLDGSLDEQQAARLVELITADGEAARRLRAAQTTAGLVVQALDQTSPEAVVRGVDVRIQAEQDASDFVATVNRALPASRFGRRWTWLLAAGGCAALVAVAVLALGTRPAPPTTPIAAVVASFRPHTGGEAGSPADGAGLVRTDGRIVLTGAEQGTLAFADEPTVFTLTGADLRILHGAPGVHCELRQGELTATVAHQQPGQPLIITTTHASAVVVGTRFRLSATTRSTRLTVLEGAVQMHDRHGATTRVDAGASCELPEDPTDPDDQALAAGALPPAPDWSPLFPGSTGLDGWSPKSGQWQRQDGGVVGWDPAGGWSRLVSTRALGDFAMTCRMRILGMNYAEIQLLDYKWFVPITPEQPQTWQSVVVQVRAGVVSAWCNGSSIPAHPGIDSPHQRFGPLGFYIRPGGRLELRDARFRETDQAVESTP